MKKLNAFVATFLKNCDFESISIIVKFNDIRHHININQIEKFAKKRNQKIYIFCVEHFRRFFSRIIDMNKFFELQNKTNVSFFDLFFYIKKMSCMLLINANIAFDHVNDVKKLLIDVFSNSKNKLLILNLNDDFC